MEPISCYLVEPTGDYTWSLSAYDESNTVCPNRTNKLGHAGEVDMGVFTKDAGPDYPEYDDPIWPKTCHYCQCPISYVMKSGCGSLSGSPHYRRLDKPEIILRSPLPPGAMYYNDDETVRLGPDGRSLVVVLPNGNHWYVDSIAGNCTVPCKCGKLYDAHNRGQTDCKFQPIDEGKHRCWVRHGVPRAGTVHVDKAGLTCNAGAGSIQSSDWHGFLTNGKLQLNR